jgi:GR25 family glycosyltransferase involved in LPS biosynthesis
MIKIVHLLSEPSTERERRSKESVSALPFERIEIINPRWTGETPPSRPCEERQFTLTPAHYGCWKAHTDAITEHLKDIDALLVCECDCLIAVPPAEMAHRINRALEVCREGNLTAFTFGFRHNGQTVDRVGEDVIVISQWIGTECYLVPIESRDTFMEMFSHPWDAYDITLTHHLYDQWRLRIGTFADRPVAIQANGVSLITGGTNTNEKHFNQLRYL